jgi:Ni,Fe-hydrogenase III small subunit
MKVTLFMPVLNEMEGIKTVVPRLDRLRQAVAGCPPQPDEAQHATGSVTAALAGEL